MKEDPVTGLEQVLERHVQLHEQLFTSARAMNAALKARDVDAVKKMSGQYDELTCRVEQVEEERLALCDALSAQLTPGLRHPALSDIIRALDGDRSARLVELRTRLKRAINDLVRVTTSNRILIEESLDLVSKTFEALTRNSSKPAGYVRQGTAAAAPVNRGIINRTA